MDGFGLAQPSMGFGLQAPQEPSMVDLWLKDVVGQHKDKQFVQRILNPGVYGNLDLGDGQVGTHLMSWSTYGKDKTPIVYPSIIQDKTGKFTQLDDDAAFNYAIKSGEYIPFKSPDQAELFSKEYKRLWDK